MHKKKTINCITIAFTHSLPLGSTDACVIRYSLLFSCYFVFIPQLPLPPTFFYCVSHLNKPQGRDGGSPRIVFTWSLSREAPFRIYCHSIPRQA
ncbi:hypothetical protein FKM82_012905 [Ascaphus truei]